jgi:hypothetical protein
MKNSRERRKHWDVGSARRQVLGKMKREIEGGLKAGLLGEGTVDDVI